MIYKRCLPCGVKAHVCARACWKCGNSVGDMTYGADDPNDAIFNAALNSVEKCFLCPNAWRGSPCKRVICFGSGRGDCKACGKYENARFNCCQKVQTKEEITVAEWRRRFHAVEGKNKEVPCGFAL